MINRKTHATTSISFPSEEMLDRAKSKAASLHRTFSNYVVTLVANDLSKKRKANNAN